MTSKLRTLALSLLLLPTAAWAMDEEGVLAWLDREQSQYAELALALWDQAELGYLET